MNKTKRAVVTVLALTASLAVALCGCGQKNTSSSEPVSSAAGSSASTAAQAAAASETKTADAEESTQSNEWFTERDLVQTPDLSDAVSVSLEDGKTVTIEKEGVYLLSGTAANAQIVVDAEDEDKVQLVLDGVSVTNETVPCIYVKNADKVFVTTTDSENTLTVSGTFTQDGETKTDAVIFSKEDLVLNGTGTLSISSSDNAISSKDDLKITGGTYEITCSGTAAEAHERIAVADGTIHVASCNDGLHAENDEDDTVGEIYIVGGTISVNAADDGIHATTKVTVDGGDLDLKAAEGIEATVVRINDGTIRIEASDDGINAAQKSNSLSILAEFNGGSVTIVMGQGDTDGIDSNGDMIINGGTLDITAQSPFDYDGTAQKNGGTLLVNGEETDEIANQFGGGMPGGGMGGPQGGGMPGGDMGGFGGPGR